MNKNISVTYSQAFMSYFHSLHNQHVKGRSYILSAVVLDVFPLLYHQLIH